MKMNAYILLLITVMIYAGNLLVGKGVNELSPIIVTFYRLLIAFLLILPFGIKQWKKTKLLIQKEWKPLLGMSATGIIIFNILVYLSLNYTSTTNAGIVESTTPIFTILLGFFFLKERLSTIQIAGVLLSLVGAVWVIAEGSLATLKNLHFNIGDIYMLLAVLLWAIYTILVKKYNHAYPVFSSLMIMLGIGVLSLMPFALWNWQKALIPFFRLDLFLSLLFLGIFPSIIALIFWNKAVEDIGATKAAIFLNLLPVFTTIGAVVFFQEEIILAQILGGLLVISGVLTTTLVKSKKKESLILKEQKNHSI